MLQNEEDLSLLMCEMFQFIEIILMSLLILLLTEEKNSKKNIELKRENAPVGIHKSFF